MMSTRSFIKSELFTTILSIVNQPPVFPNIKLMSLADGEIEHLLGLSTSKIHRQPSPTNFTHSASPPA